MPDNIVERLPELPKPEELWLPTHIAYVYNAYQMRAYAAEAVRSALSERAVPAQVVEREWLTIEWAAQLLGFKPGVHFRTETMPSVDDFSSYNQERIHLVLKGAIAALTAQPAASQRATFDTAGFDAALRRAADARGLTMKDVSEQTGVSETTLSRMHNHGRAPDAASLAALSVWAGINPARFSEAHQRRAAQDERIRTTVLRSPEAAAGGRVGQTVTDAMVSAYLEANSNYWREVDALPDDITKPWRQGTPKEATRISLEAALAASPLPAGEAPTSAWIPVSERLPTKFDEVLVAFAGIALPSTGQWTGNPRDHGGWCYPAENLGTCNDGSDPVVTHWQPLPAAPTSTEGQP